MSRQLELVREERQQRLDDALVKCVEYGLEGAVAHAGGSLTGLAVKLGEGDCLLTVKAVVAGRAQISFVGSHSLAGCLLKAEREAKLDRLRWRADKYAGG